MKEDPFTPSDPEANPSRRAEDPTQPLLGMDTAFFMSRGRLLMTAPIQELLSISERLIAQAHALGRENMIPDLQKVGEAARNLIGLYNDPTFSVPGNVKMGPLLASLIVPPAHPEQPVARACRVEKPSGDGPAPVVLVADDDAKARELLQLILCDLDYEVVEAVNGEQALATLRSRKFDLVLLDLILPEINGYQVLEQIQSDPALDDIPVIMISGLREMDGVVRCLEMGAEDFLPKPLNPVLLRVRVEACLEKKRLRDKEAAFLKQLQAEQDKSEKLLLNVLPQAIATRLKQGELTIADSLPEVTVLFADLAGFSRLATRLTPPELVGTLNEIFSAFDRLALAHGVEKIKTIGDAYMVVSGLPSPRSDHAEAASEMALAMQEEMERFNAAHQTDLSLRIGMHSGPVIAGIIGQNKFIYDLWGDTVNVASRMESQGQPGAIQVTVVTYSLLRHRYDFEERGGVEIKGKGPMTTYMLRRRRSSSGSWPIAPERPPAGSENSR